MKSFSLYGIAFVALLLMLGIISGCRKDEYVAPAGEVITASGRTSGNIVLHTGQVVVISNNYGYLVIDGTGSDSTIDWSLNTSTRAGTQLLANELLQYIRCSGVTRNDTVYISVTIQPDKAGYSYLGLLSLAIPYTKAISVDGVTGATTISDHGGTVSLSNVREVTLHHVSASTSISSLGGNISIDLALPDSDTCNAVTQDGNIIVRIPDATSASLFAKSFNGTVGITNLEITTSAQTPSSVQGILGLGLGVIHLETKKGSISLSGVY